MPFTKRSPERDKKRFEVIRENIDLANKIFAKDSSTKPWLKPEGKELVEIARSKVPYSKTTAPQDIFGWLRRTWKLETNKICLYEDRYS